MLACECSPPYNTDLVMLWLPNIFTWNFTKEFIYNDDYKMDPQKLTIKGMLCKWLRIFTDIKLPPSSKVLCGR